jgi:translation initiation factor IF-3
VNERIRIREVRLIDEDGKQYGIIPTRDALEIARERGLDLVEVQPNAAPPVCRLMDYGRFRYEESRKERESRKKAKAAVVKEVRIYPKIDPNDLKTKTRQAQRFLEAGDKVKVTVLFRGREMLHQDIGRNQLERVIADLNSVATVEAGARMEGRMLSAILTPREPKPESAGRAENLEELVAVERPARAPEPEAEPPAETVSNA